MARPLALLLALCALPAQARDAADVGSAAAAPAPHGPWQGGYAGVELSYGSADPGRDLGGQPSTGGFYGLNAGWRADLGRVVAGGEVSYDRTDITFADGSDVDNLLRAGVQVGWDAGRFLPYLAGGYAGASVPNNRIDFDDQFHGGFWGGGIAYAVSGNLVLEGAALRHRFDASSTDAALTTVSGKLTWRF